MKETIQKTKQKKISETVADDRHWFSGRLNLEIDRIKWMNQSEIAKVVVPFQWKKKKNGMRQFSEMNKKWNCFVEIQTKTNWSDNISHESTNAEVVSDDDGQKLFYTHLFV